MKLYNDTVSINLDESGGKHQYSVTDSEKGLENATMRGVTDIKRQIIAKPGLMLWPMDMALTYLKERGGSPTSADFEAAAKAHTIRRDSGADVGTAVHAAIELYLTKMVTTDIVGSKEGNKALNAFIEWFASSGAKVIATEQPVYSRERQYCGKFDALLEIDGETVLVDFKTTNVSAYALRKNKEWTGLYPEDFMQLGFYSNAYEEEFDVSFKGVGKETRSSIDDLMLINCTKDGKLHTLTASEIGWTVEDCEELAMSALNISDGLKKIKKDALSLEA